MEIKFNDRKDAGIKLSRKLLKYKNKNAVVLAIPRGGVEVGYEVAKKLNAEFSLIITRKLPYPSDPEAGFGAVAEDGTLFIFEKTALDENTINEIILNQKKEAQRRVNLFRKKPLPDLKGKTIIIADDGLAMGSTMTAAVRMCRKKGAQKIICAVPVSGRFAMELVKKEADEVFAVSMPADFYAVAQAYKNWHDVADSEVINIMAEAQVFEELVKNKVLGKRARKIIDELSEKYGKISFLDRGRHSVIILLDSRYVAKIEKDIPAGKNSAKKEAKWLKLLQKHKICPGFVYYSPKLRYAVYEYVKGFFIKDKINAMNKDELKETMISSLKKARILDRLKLNKEEMHRPVKHIIVNSDCIFIDFERTKKTSSPKNVSQLMHYFMLNNADKRIGFDRQNALELIKEYKTSGNKESVFKKISSLIERQ